MTLKIKLATITTITTSLLLSWPLMAKNGGELPESFSKNLVSTSLSLSNLEKPPLLAQKIDNRKRIALVVGNANYTNQLPLANPINDANDISQQLKQIGFEVILVRNGNQQKLDRALEEFYQKLEPDSVSLFYYAGHAIQVNGENYLIPTDASLKTESDVRYETLPLGKVLDKMYEAKSEVKIVILDACRDNPFARSWSKSRSLQTRGLAQVQGNGEGEFIVYATQPGNISADGDKNNGVFTYHLLKYLTIPNKTIEEVFKLVRQGVAQETNKQQVPFTSNGLIGDFYFNPQVDESINDSTVVINSAPQPDNSFNNLEQNTSFSWETNLIAAAPNQNEEEMYQKLEAFLRQADFQKADAQTWELMKQVGNGGNKIDLSAENIQNSCAAFKKIDQLWLKYSQGKFGLSVQKNIWQSVGGNPDAGSAIYDLFALKVGWKKGNQQNLQYKSYEQLNFSPDTSPRGELPTAGRWVKGGDGGAWLIVSDCDFSS